MKTLYRFLFLVLFLGLIPLSCDDRDPKDPCEPPPPVYPDFEINDLGVDLITPYAEDVDTSLFHPAKDVSLQVSVTERTDVVFAPERTGLSFQSMAYACSPLPGSSAQFITDVEITAANRLGYGSQYDTINVGDIITDRFGFALNYPDYYEPLNKVLDEDPRFMDYQSFYIQLNSGPYQPVTMVLDVEVTLSDGQVFSFENEVLKVH